MTSMLKPTLTLLVLLLGQASAARIRRKAKQPISLAESKQIRASALEAEFSAWEAANKEFFEESPSDPEKKVCDAKSMDITRTLFDDVNHKLLEWEKGSDDRLKCPEDNHILDTTQWPAGVKPDVAIVYGGKPPTEKECSGECTLDSENWDKGAYNGMPSSLVAALWSLLPDTTVISISTSKSSRNMTGSNKHVQGNLLADNPDGILDLLDTEPRLFAGKTIMVFSTYAAHDPNPAASLANIKAAKNVGKDLEKLKMLTSANRIHVVLTGTDATNKASDSSRQYNLGYGNYHYGLSKIAQGFYFEYLQRKVSTHDLVGQDGGDVAKAKNAFDRIENFIIGLGDFEDKTSIGKRMDRSSDKDKALTMTDEAFKVGNDQGGKFSDEMCALFQDEFEFKATSIIQIGVMLTDLHVPRKCMANAGELGLGYKGTKWMTGALSVIISPQYSTIKHLTYVPGRITN